MRSGYRVASIPGIRESGETHIVDGSRADNYAVVQQYEQKQKFRLHDQTALTQYPYGSRQASYDLKKFRGKQMVVRIAKTRRYEASPEALRALSAVVLLQNKVIQPVLASVAQSGCVAASSSADR